MLGRETNYTLIRKINQSLFNGLTSKEFISKKQLLIAPDWTVGDLIEAGLKSGVVRWNNKKLIFDCKKVKIYLQPEDERALRKKVFETECLPSELVYGLIRKYITRGMRI